MPVGNSASIFARTARANTGAVPAVDTATVTGSRSMIAGMMKLDSSGASTTLTGMPAAFAAFETSASTRESPVAAITTAWRPTSSEVKERASRRTSPLLAMTRRLSPYFGATTTTIAPA